MVDYEGSRCLPGCLACAPRRLPHLVESMRAWAAKGGGSVGSVPDSGLGIAANVERGTGPTPGRGCRPVQQSRVRCQKQRRGRGSRRPSRTPHLSPPVRLPDNAGRAWWSTGGPTATQGLTLQGNGSCTLQVVHGQTPIGDLVPGQDLTGYSVLYFASS